MSCGVSLAFFKHLQSGDFHITSAGNIASNPYKRKKGDCPVALLGCVRSPQITDEISLIHLPPFLLFLS
jgi:hypothetical protein